MDKQRCPACGEVFDGKVCRSCRYTPFQEEKKMPRWVVLAVILVVLAVAASVAEPYVTAYLEKRNAPAQMPLPEDGTVLFDGNGVTVVADWQDGQLFGDGVTILAKNGTEEKISIAFKEIVANGYVMETSLFQLSVEPGTTESAQFTLHETDLSNTGIQAVTEVSFNLTAYGTHSFTSLAKTDRLTLKGAIPPGYVQSVESDGVVLYDEEGVKIVFRSFRPSEEEPEDYTKGKFLFYIQNSTKRHLRISMPEVLVNEQPLDIGIWSELLPDTKAVTGMYLYRLKDLGIENPTQVRTLSYTLEITDRDDENFHILTEPYVIPMG